MATSRIKGITVEIDGDTTGLSKALSSVNKEMKSTQSQLKDVEKLLKRYPLAFEKDAGGFFSLCYCFYRAYQL
ncbi:MAG: hypothetical protein LIO92_09905 [Clostridiales bacterium]|nr:hypothetical protein [Clostridiales bacterium]